MAAADYVTVVQQLYVAYFGRPADTKGLTDFCAALDVAGVPATLAGVEAAYRTNAAVKATVDSFGTSTESTNLYGTGDNASFVMAIYQNVLGRSPDTDGYKFWVDAMNAGAVSKANVSLSIMAAAMVNTSTQGQADASLITKKIAISANFTTAITTENATYSGDAAAAAARAMLKLVVSTTVVADFQVTIVETLKVTTSGPVGQTFTLTTGADILVGTALNDKFEGAATTYAAADQVIDSSTTDNDTYNLSIGSSNLSADNSLDAVANDVDGLSEVAPKVTNVENVNVTLAATAGANVFASQMVGVKNLTVTRSDLNVSGSTIAGDKTVNVSEVDATKVAKVTVGAGTTDVTVSQSSTSTSVYTGVVVEAGEASGDVTVTGPAYVVAGSGATKTVSVQGTGTAAQDKGAVTVKAAKAGTVNVGNTTVTTGTVTIEAAAAKSVSASVAGGGSIKALGGKAADGGITVTAIDDSGVTVTTSYVGTKTTTVDNSGAISLTGSSGAADTATVNAAGEVALTLSNLANVTLSGNGAAATYTISTSAAKTTLTGDQSVTVVDSAANLAGKTLVDSTTAGTTTVKFDGAVAGASDFSKLAADKFMVAADLQTTGTNTVKFGDGATLILAKDQTAGRLDIIGNTAKSTLNLWTADDTNADGSTIEISVGALAIDSAVSTVNIDATVGKFTATSTNFDAEATLNIVGTKDVALGNISNGKVINAATSTGKISLATTSTTLKTITTGTGADNVTANAEVIYAVDLGNGDDVLDVSAAATSSSFATGDGADTVTIRDADAIVVVTGAGDDTVKVAAGTATDAVIVMGEGSGDKLVFLADADLKSNKNFAVTGVETVDLTEAGQDIDVVVSSASFANDNAFKLAGTANGTTLDTFKVVNMSSTAGATIDASGVTFNSTQDVKLILAGAAHITGTSQLVDTITGSAKNDTILASAGADVVAGGEGTDTYETAALHSIKEDTVNGNASTGVVVNLGTTDITNTAILGANIGYTANSITSVAGGKVAYVFSGSSANNSAVTQSLNSIENVVGTDGKDYIVGSAGANRLEGGAEADYIVGGLGADTIVGGAGNDTIVLTETTSAADIVVFGANAAANGSDTITGFTTTVDKLNLDALTADTASVTVTGTLALAAAKVYFLGTTVAGNADTATAAAAALNGAATLTDLADGGVTYFVINDDNSAAVYSYTAATGATGITAAELTLMGTVDAKVVAADLAFA